MVQKIKPIQPVSNKHKQELKKNKDGLSKKKPALFAGVLESKIQSGKYETVYW